MRVRERTGGRDADPQAGERARPDADRDPVELREVEPGLVEQLERERQQLAHVPRPLAGAPARGGA